MGPHIGRGLLRVTRRRVLRDASAREGRRLRPGSQWLERRRLLAIALSPTNWTDIGPAPIVNNLTGNNNVAEAGRITAAAWGSQGLYIAAAGGGVWRTTDLNGDPNPIPTDIHWTPLGQTQASLSNVPLFIGSLAVAGLGPGGQDVIIAGTGEPDNTATSFYGRGLLVSTDGGATWSQFNDGGLFDRVTISKVVAPVINPNLPYYGEDSAIVAIGPPGTNGLRGSGAPLNSGVYAFADVSGAERWTNLSSGLPGGDYTVSDLVQDPVTGQLYAAIGDYRGSGINGVYALDDKTMTWIPSGNFPMGVADGRITLAIGDDTIDLLDHGVTPTVYAAIAGSGQGNARGQLVNMLVMHRNPALISPVDPMSPANDIWTALPMTPPASQQYLGQGADVQGSFDNALFLPISVPAPTDLMASGVGDGPYSVMETTVTYDGQGANPSTNWTDLSQDAAGNQPHADHHYLGDGYPNSIFSPGGAGSLSDLIFDGDDGGLWTTQANFSTNAPNPWTDLNGNLEITQFNSIALDPTDPNTVYGGSQDNGTEKFSGNLAWSQVDGGDGGVVLVDPRPGQSQTIYHTFYRSATNPQDDNPTQFIQFSTDGGATWNPLVQGINAGDPSDFYPPMAATVVPANPAMGVPVETRLLVGTSTVYEQNIAGDPGDLSWSSIGAGNPGWIAGATVHSIAVSSTHPGTIYASLGNATASHVLVTTNNGQSWTEINPPAGSHTLLLSLQIDPSNDQTVYGVSPFFDSSNRSGHVFRLTFNPATGQQSWTDISGGAAGIGGLPDLPTHALALDTQNGQTILYAGNDTGVWTSDDGGQTWNPLGGQIPHTQVTSLQIGRYASGDILAAATYGRGAWEIQIPQSLPSISINDVSMNEGDAGTTEFNFTVSLSAPSVLPVSVEVQTVDGAATSPRDYGAVNLELTFAPGQTTQTYTVDVVGNTLYEHDETFNVDLSSPSGATIAKGQGIGTILNDDPAPTLNVTVAGPVLRPLTGTVDLVFTVTLVGATELPARVEYETDDLTATSPDDYMAQSGVLVFNPGDTILTVRVPVVGGVQSDPTRAFDFHLDGAIDATIQDGDAIGTIDGNAQTLDVEPLPPVQPDPRNAPVPSIEVVFSGAIRPGSFGAGALSLTLDGSAVPLTSPLTFDEVDASTYMVAGLAPLTMADGTYTLTVDSGAVLDAGGAAGDGIASTSWVMDTQPPTSAVEPLPQRESSLAFPVAAGGIDSGSGIASYAVYVATDGGPFTLWQTLAASAPSAEFTGQSGHTYAFYSVATDLAGNVEAKAPIIEASTYVADLDPPALHVTAVDDTSPTFTVSWSGTEAGGSGLAAVDLYAAIDGGTPRQFAQIPGGAESGTTYAGTATYKAIADGATHTYRFYAIGIDGAGNVEATPSDPDADVVASAAFPGPSAFQVVSLTVQGGAPRRSFVRYVDINFNETGAALQELIDDHRIRLVQHQLDGMARPTDPTIDLSTATLTAIDHAIEVDFGAGGVGGNPSSTAGDGYYEFDLDLDGSGAFATREFFYRLLGDVDGDQAVDLNDLDLITAALGEVGLDLLADVNGDGTVSAFDRALASRTRGRHLAVGLELDG